MLSRGMRMIHVSDLGMDLVVVVTVVGLVLVDHSTQCVSKSSLWEKWWTMEVV